MPDPSTTRLALYKSKSDGSELVNYTQDIGQNWDKVDSAVGFASCTSSTRPSSPYSGKPIFQTDTAYSTYFSNGTSPASASWIEIPNSSSTFGSNLKLASGSQLVIGADVNLFRNAANVLRTNDALTVDGALTASSGLTVTGSITASINLTVGASASFTGNIVAANYSTVVDWTTPGLASGYTGDGNGNGTPQYRVINILGTQFVQWRGGLNVTYSGSSPVNSGMPFTANLAANARPASRRSTTVACSASSSSSLSIKLDFNTDGSVTIVNMTGVTPPWVAMNNIMYSL